MANRLGTPRGAAGVPRYEICPIPRSFRRAAMTSTTASLVVVTGAGTSIDRAISPLSESGRALCTRRMARCMTVQGDSRR